jgi:molybdopterin molybdotransferase
MPVTFEEAVSSILSLAGRKSERTILLPNAAGEILSRDVVADRNIPPFPRAAMDGFAVRWTGKEDERSYRIVGTVNPGQSWAGEAGDDECIKIMTGAPVTAPFDTVIPVEQSEFLPEDRVRFLATVYFGQNVAAEGEDGRKGEILIPRGTLLQPRHIATLAAVGLWEVPVSEQPTVAILATGGELKEPWESAGGPFIRNCNAHFLLSALRTSGFETVGYLGVVPDERDALQAKIREGLSSDFLVLTGGVSAGEIDIVPECLAACGVEKILHKVSVKPGKPVFVGKTPGGGLVIGLPGNPVAVIVHYSMLIRPLFLKTMGATEYLPKPIWLPLAGEAHNKGEQKKFSPARVESVGKESRVVEIPSHGSGDFVAASRADGVFEIPLGVNKLPAGAKVRFYPVWGELLTRGG